MKLSNWAGNIIEGKVWGNTVPLLQSSCIEIHKIMVDAGGYCSKHTHQSKVNAFYVIEGRLEIHRWKSYDLVDVTVLHSGDMSIVPAGEPHMFKAITPVEALEIYWAELDHDDIQRDTVGGCDKTPRLENSC